MRRFARVCGFTLMEVGLAITVGTILVAAGVFAYIQARDSAGDANARQRVADLQVMVEDYYTRFQDYPQRPTLGDLWASRRPDATSSPWGGLISLEDGNETGVSGQDLPSASTGSINGVEDPDCAGSDSLAERRAGKCSATQWRDNLAYFRHPPPATCCWKMWDVNKQDYISFSSYAIGHNKQGRGYYFVTIGRPGL